jgi:hypothetical protein
MKTKYMHFIIYAPQFPKVTWQHNKGVNIVHCATPLALLLFIQDKKQEIVATNMVQNGDPVHRVFPIWKPRCYV